MPASEQPRDLRVALAMNGGVSLAVWIGGVASEFYRAARGEGLYGALSELTKTNVVVDVLTGASAGGLNGAFVAAAQSRDLPGSVFDGLRDVWLSAGSFEHLLRDPSEKDPPSILRGDDYFLSQVERVLLGWLANNPVTAVPSDRPDVDLVLTATTLEPIATKATDAEGNPLVDPQHRARFTFTGKQLRETPARKLASQLARAARTSASFPGAFEPSYVQVGPGSDVDMADVTTFTQSMWAIDGGVLVNKPIGPAFELIERHRFSRDGKRVLVYVNPDPGTPIATTAAARTPIPPIGTVVRKALVDIPREESIGEELAAMNDYNRRYGLRRKLRETLLLGVPVDGPEGGDTRVPLEKAASDLYVLWLRRDGIQVADSLVRAELARLNRTFDDPVRPPDPWSERWTDVADALRDARGRKQFLAGHFPTTSTLERDGTWPFGYRSVDHACQTVWDLTRRALDLLPDANGRSSLTGDFANVAAQAAELRPRIIRARQQLQAIRDQLSSLARADTMYWANRLAELTAAPPESLRAWADNAYSSWLVSTPGTATNVRGTDLIIMPGNSIGNVWMWLRQQMDAVVRVVVENADDLWQAADLGRRWRGYREDRPFRSPGILKRLLAALVRDDPDSWMQRPPLRSQSGCEISRRLLALFVLHDATEDIGSDESRVEFIQLSADLTSPLDPTRTAADKVRGLDLGHFGGFVKTSWRANDWMWGCLDGTAQIVDLLLDPERLRQVYPSKDAFVSALARTLSAADLTNDDLPASQRAELAATWTPAEVARRLDDEVDFLDPPGVSASGAASDRGDSQSVPARLTRTTALVAYVLQQAVAARELPAVAAAIARSSDEGADTNVDAKQFTHKIDGTKLVDGQVPIAHTAGLLAACRVGSELMRAEVGSDALTKVMASTGAVTTGALSGKSGGVGPLRFVFGGARRVMATVSVLVDSALKGTRAAFAVTMILLAVGGGLVAGRLVGADVPTGPLVVGAALLAGFVALVTLIVGWRRALASIGVLVAVFFLASITESDARVLCCSSGRPAWKPIVHWGGAIGLTALGAIVAWLLHAEVQSARKQFNSGDGTFAKRIRDQIAAVEKMTSLPVDQRTAAIADLRDRLGRRRVELELAVYRAQDRVDNAVLIGLGTAIAWWIVFALVRFTAHERFVHTVRWIHSWRALWLLAAFPLAALLASVRSRLFAKR